MGQRCQMPFLYRGEGVSACKGGAYGSFDNDHPGDRGDAVLWSVSYGGTLAERKPGIGTGAVYCRIDDTCYDQGKVRGCDMRHDNHDDGDYYFYYRHYGQDGGRFCDSDGRIVELYRS